MKKIVIKNLLVYNQLINLAFFKADTRQEDEHFEVNPCTKVTYTNFW